MIKCKQCGFNNQPGHLFCVKCKNKLDLEQISVEDFTYGRRCFRHWREVLIGVIIFLIMAAVLAFWPPQTDSTRITKNEGDKVRRKVALLQQGTTNNAVEFSEREVNTLLNLLIQERRNKYGTGQKLLNIYAAQVKIKPGSFNIRVIYQGGPWVVGPLTVGPFLLSFHLSGVPQSMPDGLHLVPKGGSIGYLPVPVIGGNLALTRLKELFAPFKNARNLLSKLEIVEMKKGSILVSLER
jgi:hypothetical protein